MHALHLILFIYIHALIGLCHGAAAAEAMPSAQLLPDSFFALHDYEVLSVHEEAEQDVVRIRKRADKKDCESDCISYSGWTDDGLMQCEADEGEPENEPDDPALIKRGAKPKPLYVPIFPARCHY